MEFSASWEDSYMKSDPKECQVRRLFQSKVGLAHTVFSDEAINVSQWAPSIVLASLNFIGASDKFMWTNPTLTFEKTENSTISSKFFHKISTSAKYNFVRL